MTAVSALVLAASGVGHAMVNGLSADMSRIDPFHGLTHRPRDTGGMNFLVVGIDKRSGLSAAQRQKYKLGGAACDCTDTLLLVHISADHRRVSVVSLPRDSYTQLPDRSGGGSTKPAKLNSAYARGGAPLTVNVVEAMTKVHIDHYLEVDFNSFMNTVDVLGGVPVCTEKPLHDSYSGLDLPAGTTRLNGGQALQYVRARHLGDGSDLSRMRRQQRFLASVIDKATASGVMMNPVKFNKVASTLLDSVRADKGFGSEEMLALGRAMKGLTAAGSEFASVPIADPDHRVPGLGSTVKWDEAKSKRLFGALRNDRPLTPRPQHSKKPNGANEAKARTRGLLDGAAQHRGSGTTHGAPVDVPPDDVRVQVENGTEEPGLGRRVDQELRGTGFATTGAPRNASGHDHAAARTTTISYDPRWARSARALAEALPGAALVRKEGQGPRMRVTLGAEHHAVRQVQTDRSTAGADDAPPGDGPSSDPDSGADNGADNGAVRGDKVKCR